MQNQLINIQQMYKTCREGRGFDWIIIVSPTEDRANFWGERLKIFKGQIVSKNTKIISQVEDWLGGAGQLLGTLYAFKKANKNFNLENELKNGKKIAIYHTAGAGKRMAPLSLVAGKSAIELPRVLSIPNNRKTLLTLLEAVIFSTQIFAPSREKRVCVFWGDQVIVPETSPEMEENSHIELFGIKKKIPPSPNHWKKNWQSYGILVLNEKGEYLQREKLSWEELEEMKRGLGLREIQKSLGFFSISLPFLQALLKEFQLELEEKRGKLDTDPHLWMPLTSSLGEYQKSGGSKEYWKRIQNFREKFLAYIYKIPLFRGEDLGKNSFWWDFGQISTYQKNLFKILSDNLEGRCLRKFFGLEKAWQKEKIQKNLEIRNSILVNSKVQGKVEQSLILNSRVRNLNVKKSLLFNVEALEFWGRNGLAYNLQEPKKILLRNKDVLVDVFSKLGKIRMQTKWSRNGKADWEKRIFKNPLSYQRLIQLL